MSTSAYKTRPLIGLIPSHTGEAHRLSIRYLDSVWRAGGNPVILAYTLDPAKLAEYAAIFDGFVFCGGVDVDPARYGEEKQFDSVEIDPERDDFEKAMFETVYPTGKPILGICRGIQSINVWLGGTLHQHLDGHRQEIPGWEKAHTIQVVEGTLLHRLTGKTELWVNTFHHQAVKALAPGLEINAMSPDGYIEALSDPRHPFLIATQFHPEIYNNMEGDDHSRHVFEAFIKATGK